MVAGLLLDLIESQHKVYESLKSQSCGLKWDLSGPQTLYWPSAQEWISPWKQSTGLWYLWPMCLVNCHLYPPSGSPMSMSELCNVPFSLFGVILTCTLGLFLILDMTQTLSWKSIAITINPFLERASKHPFPPVHLQQLARWKIKALGHLIKAGGDNPSVLDQHSLSQQNRFQCSRPHESSTKHSLPVMYIPCSASCYQLQTSHHILLSNSLGF